ncbi:MAG: hypothetical protein ACETVZ_04545 [Phycisphaerae bacterium]
MIKCRCNKCGQKFSIPEIHAGKKGKCPKCKNIVIIPKYKTTEPEVPIARATDDKTKPEKSPLDSAVFDVPPPEQISQTIEDKKYHEDIHTMYDGIAGTASYESKEQTSERKLPWLLDIFLYPVSKAGLITIAVIIALRLITDIAAVLLLCCIFGGILGLILRIVIVYSYMYWYFSECIRDSAAGSLRAPETLMPGLSDMVWHWFRLFACYAFFLGPVTFYSGYTYFSSMQMNSVIFWSMLTYGVFFFPIGILAVVMFDSVNGLNPVLLIRSIVSTFLQYCGLVILFYGLGVLFGILLYMVVSILPRFGVLSYMFLAYILFNIFFLYVLLIAAHLLGRFYWRYEEKLNWEV